MRWHCGMFLTTCGNVAAAFCGHLAPIRSVLCGFQSMLPAQGLLQVSSINLLGLRLGHMFF
jgi:hypothetical protein